MTPLTVNSSVSCMLVCAHEAQPASGLICCAPRQTTSVSVSPVPKQTGNFVSRTSSGINSKDPKQSFDLHHAKDGQGGASSSCCHRPRPIFSGYHALFHAAVPCNRSAAALQFAFFAQPFCRFCLSPCHQPPQTSVSTSELERQAPEVGSDGCRLCFAHACAARLRCPPLRACLAASPLNPRPPPRCFRKRVSCVSTTTLCCRHFGTAIWFWHRLHSQRRVSQPNACGTGLVRASKTRFFPSQVCAVERMPFGLVWMELGAMAHVAAPHVQPPFMSARKGGLA
jgi:hypothetical protein